MNPKYEDKIIPELITEAEYFYPGTASALSSYGIDPYFGGELERMHTQGGMINDEVSVLTTLSQWDAKIWREYTGKLEYELNSKKPDFGAIKTTVTDWFEDYVTLIYCNGPIQNIVKASLSIAIDLSTAASRDDREDVLSHYEEDWNEIYDCIDYYLESPLKGSGLDLLIFNSIASLDLYMATVPTEKRIDLQLSIMEKPKFLLQILFIASGVIGFYTPFVFFNRASLVLDSWFWIPLLVIANGTGSLTLAYKEKSRLAKLKSNLLAQCENVAAEYIEVLSYKRYRHLTPVDINQKLREIVKRYDWPMDEKIMSLLLLSQK